MSKLESQLRIELQELGPSPFDTPDLATMRYPFVAGRRDFDST